MKKQLFMGITVLAAASMLCGFDSAETLESLSEKMTAASASVESMSAVMDVILDASLNISDGSTNVDTAINAVGSFTLDYLMNPMTMKMAGNVDLSALSEGESMDFESYIVTDEDGEVKAYIGVNGDWVVQTADDLNINDLIAASGTFVCFSDLADWGIAFELAPEAADANGTECYLLSTTDTLNTLIQKASEKSGQDLSADENVSTILALLTGIQINLEYYIDAETYLPVRMHMDLNDSDLSIINQIIAASMNGMVSEDAADSSVELVLNDLSAEVSTFYDGVDEIVVPEEALAAEAVAAAE